MARVIIDQVTKVYGEQVVAVNNISLDIADKEFVVLVGPSGCGKSTTLRMVAGLEAISKGTISIDGRDFSLRDYWVAHHACGGRGWLCIRGCVWRKKP